MFGMDAMILQLRTILAEAKARQEWINSLPKEEADRVRADDAWIARDKELHRRELEVAEAGRPRNFWGK